MAHKNFWQMLKQLPIAVKKTEGRYQGTYEFTMNNTDGVFFIEYILNDEFGLWGTEVTYPKIFSGDSFEEVVTKAFNFFQINKNKYEVISNNYGTQH